MHCPRFFLSPGQINPTSNLIVIEEPGMVKQIRAVLRLEKGQPVIVLDGQGNLYSTTIHHLSAKQVSLKITDKRQATGDPTIRVTMALPLLKGDRFDWAVQKLTEIGIWQIQPVVAKRSVVKQPPERLSNRLTRWQAIARQAAEQCERESMPTILPPISLAVYLASDDWRTYSKHSVKLICAERKEAPLLSQFLDKIAISCSLPRNMAIVVGPEGGLAPEEIDQACHRDAQMVSLGPRILRVETAAIYALAQIISRCGDG